MKTVFVDVDTQIDFLYPAGALYVPGAEALLPVLARLNQYAAAQSIPVLSTMDAHLEDDPEFTVPAADLRALYPLAARAAEADKLLTASLASEDAAI